MGYRFRRDERVEDGLRRIATEQIDKALHELDTLDDRHAIAHQVRKRCKKLRGLIRLVRPVFADYADQNAWFRDTARLLSDPRDALVRTGTLAALRERHAEVLVDDAFADVADALASQCHEAANADDMRAAFEDCRERLREAKSRVAAWTLGDTGFDAIAGGLEKTYRRARRGMSDARDERSAGNVHEWRKRAKYHWYHLRLLENVWPGVMTPWAQQAHRLSNRLGEAHDLAVLGDTLPEVGDALARDTLRALIEHRRTQLQDKGLRKGARLLAEPPELLCERLRGYWKAWRAEVAP